MRIWHDKNLQTINKFERKISGKGVVRAGKGFTPFLLNEDSCMKIVWSLEDSNVSNDCITGTAKHEMKKQKGRFLGALLARFAASFLQTVVSSVVKGISARGIQRAGTRDMDKNF